MLFFYIRHGEPIYHPDSLTPQGKLQAEALAKRLCLFGIDKVFVSTALRTQETAEPTCKILRLEPTLLEWCREGLCGADFYNREKDLWVFQDPAWRPKLLNPEVLAMGRNWYEHPDFKDTTFKSGILRIQEESDRFFEELGYRHDTEKNCYIPEHPNDDRVALFAHQGFGEAFLSCLLDIPYPLFSTHFDFGFSSMTVIEFKEIGGTVIPKVLQLANDSHLYREGLPLCYQNKIRF